MDKYSFPPGRTAAGAGGGDAAATTADMSTTWSIFALFLSPGDGTTPRRQGEIYQEFQFRFPEYATLFPETVPVLEELRRRGYRLGG